MGTGSIGAGSVAKGDYRPGMIIDMVASEGYCDAEMARQKRDEWRSKAAQTQGMSDEQAEKWRSTCRAMEARWADKARALSTVSVDGDDGHGNAL